jgi:hypothetical protein
MAQVGLSLSLPPSLAQLFGGSLHPRPPYRIPPLPATLTPNPEAGGRMVAGGGTALGS